MDGTSPAQSARPYSRSMACYLAVDVGGTKLAAGLVDLEGRLLERHDGPTEPSDPWPGLERLVGAVLASATGLAAGPVLAVGVGCGGPMTEGGGTVSPLNIPGWRDFPLRARLAELTGLAVSVDNDAKALALGEGWCGAAQGLDDYVAMVVSTGVGGGIVVDGRLLDGLTGNAGHIGHLVVEPEGRACGCGGRGCLEAEASGSAIAAITGRPAAEASPAVRRRTGRLVGRALAQVCVLLDVGVAVVAGSVALGFGSVFFEAAQARAGRALPHLLCPRGPHPAGRPRPGRPTRRGGSGGTTRRGERWCTRRVRTGERRCPVGSVWAVQPTYSAEAEGYREKVQAFLAEHLPTMWTGTGQLEGEELDQFVAEWRQTLYEHGYLAPGWPKEYGGAGLSALEQVVLGEELTKAGVPSGAPNDVFGIQMLGNTLQMWGTEEQKAHYLPRILSAEDRWCQGYSEPNAGSDLGNLGCRAVLDGDQWVINGQKVWTSAGHLADHIFLLARTDPDVPKHKGISFLLVDLRQPGVEVRPIKMISGESEFNEILLHGRGLPEGRRRGRRQQRLGGRDDAPRVRARRGRRHGADPLPGRARPPRRDGQGARGQRGPRDPPAPGLVLVEGTDHALPRAADAHPVPGRAPSRA